MRARPPNLKLVEKTQYYRHTDKVDPDLKYICNLILEVGAAPLSLEQLDILRLALERDLRDERPFDTERDRAITQQLHAEVLARIKQRTS